MKKAENGFGGFGRIREMFSGLFREEADIQIVLLNLILAAAVIGGIVSWIFSIVAGTDGNAITALLIVVLGCSLWIINVWKKPQFGAVLVDCFANLVFFPIMYFYQGGIHSGMLIWMLLGMVFAFLIIKGRICYIIYVLNAVVVAGCITIEYYHPELVHHLDEQMMSIDIFQSVLLVSCVFGVIFRYQSHIYRRQQRYLMEQDDKLRLTLEKLQQANQAKSTFLANMSHEIRTPINAVLGMNEMIVRESSEEVITKYALNIESAGRNLLSLVNDILDFSKIESGKMEILPVEYDVASLLNDSYNIIIMRAKEKNLEVRIENDSSIPSELFGDEVRIRQIISNLMTNAVKYTKVGSVTLSLDWERLQGSMILLKIAVTDTGMGITPENKERLFFSFQRVDEERNRNIEGTGLGLAITKQLVDLMGGSISVESEYGKGSVFRLEIPQRIISEVPMGDFSKRYERTEKSDRFSKSFLAPRASVLVVDDVEMNLEVMKGLLKHTKLKIDTALSGEQCLEMIKEKKYHIIFMDHMMPGMDGVETLQAIRNMPEQPNIDTPVIALTANAILGAEQEYLAQGFQAYLSKPVRSDELEKITADYLPKDLVMWAKDLQKEKRTPSFLEKLSFLDTETGLSFCAGKEELYKKVLQSYLDPKRYAAVIEMYEKGDWHNYKIQVHSVKSSSLAIGAKHLSLQAKRLEVAARDGDIEYIRHHNESFLRNYQEIYAKLNEVMQDE